MKDNVEDPPTPQEQHLMELLGRRQSTRPPPRRSFEGPLRAVKLCLMCIMLPGMLVSVPLYLRYHVYYRQEYPLSMSDMRILNTRVSTTWCQNQLVRANATFNAYVVDGMPVVVNDAKHVSMSRHLVLEDDMKEYWAFYLLKGSTVTVSTCVRWQGASLIIIKGHKHLRECAYIGDDSSEEDDEIQEELELKGATARTGNQDTSPGDEETVGKMNTPNLMRRARPGVQLHGLQQPLSSTEQLKRDSSDTSEENDNVLARVLLRKATDKTKSKGKHENLNAFDSSPNKRIRNNKLAELSDSKTTPPTSSEIFEEVLNKIKLLGPRGKTVLQKLNEQLGVDGDQELKSKIQQLLASNEDQFQTQEVEGKRDEKMSRGERVETEDVKKSSGNGLENEDVTKSSGEEVTKNGDVKKDIDEGVTEKYGASVKGKERKRRELSFGGRQSLENLFNKHNEDEDTAIEEDLEPDGIADHHRTLNQTTDGDHSNSEFWSSFSSSEEALLQCSGLVLNLPLTPHRRCLKHGSSEDHAQAALPNTITYKVPSTGYYFFVFSSENEIQPNYFRVHFQLDKTMYNVTNPVASCKNTTESCSLPLSFWSYDTVILELPVGRNDSAWNEDFVVESTCEPRTAVYLICVIAVPFFILMFALQ